MDIENLTKHQLLLLTLLVSFITSIATGIVTVSLINQAPPGITRVVNQIVERTVETVTPASQGAAASTATTVVVRDDDLAAESIATVQKSIIRITKRNSDELVARGILLDRSGLAVTDRMALEAAGGGVFTAILATGEQVPAVLRSGGSGSLAYLDVVVGTSTGFEPATLGAYSAIKLGQTVIRIGGVGTDSVNTGVISSIPQTAAGSESVIEASVSADVPGSIVLTIFGEVVGITTGSSRALGAAFYTVPVLSAN